MTLSAGKVVWLSFKWLIVPCALGAVGYYVIGPRIGQVPALEMGARKVQSIVRREPEEPVDTATPDGGVTDASGPEVTISVEKADRKPRSGRRSTTSSTRRSTSSDPKPPEPKRPEGEQADPASGGGAVSPTTGGDPVFPPPATTGTTTGTGTGD